MSNIGKTMKEGQTNAWKELVAGAGILVYIIAIVYAEVHGYSLLVAGIDPDLLIWAVAGIFALGITALMLPLGLHFKFFDAKERMAAWGFYAIDIVLLFLNAVIDSAARKGGMPEWGNLYLTYVVPANPVIAGLGWSILLMLDPAQRQRSTMETLRASTQLALAEAIAEEAKNTELEDDVKAAARQLAQDTVRELLGETIRRNGSRRVIDLPHSAIHDAPEKLPAASRPAPRKITGIRFPVWPKKKTKPVSTPAAAPEPTPAAASSNGQQPPDPTNQR